MCYPYIQVFDVLKEQSSNWVEKIKMVEGVLEQPDLGLNEEDLHHVSDEVSVVFHTAATIKFDAPLRCVHLCVVCVRVCGSCMRTYLCTCVYVYV